VFSVENKVINVYIKYVSSKCLNAQEWKILSSTNPQLCIGLFYTQYELYYAWIVLGLWIIMWSINFG